MKWLTVLSVFLVVLLTGCDQQAVVEHDLAKQTEAEATFDFLDTQGNGYLYADLRGQWQVINYWATWCAPCIKEIPELIQLGENHDDIVVFGVNFDAPPAEEMARQIQRMKITFPVYAQDPAAQLGIDMPQVLPTTVLVDPEGTVRQVLVGPQTEESLLEMMRPAA